MHGIIMATSASTGRAGGAILFAAILGIALVLLPGVLGERLSVSPMLLFGAAAVSTVCNHLVPGRGGEPGALYSRAFFLRLAASSVAVFGLLGVYRLAQALG
jgi:hypothetical protein